MGRANQPARKIKHITMTWPILQVHCRLSITAITEYRPEVDLMQQKDVHASVAIYNIPELHGTGCQ